MTGEVCLKGDVTAVGGIGAKFRAAVRAGATKIVYPSDNKKDVTRLVEYEGLELGSVELVCVDTVSQAISHILEPPPN